MRGAEIVLPHGTTFVYVDEAPALLASAIYPERPPGRRLVVLQKLSAHEGARPESLTPCDELKFAEVCAGLPPLFVGATEAEWRPYLAAFSAADNRPDWTPSPVWNDSNGFASMLRASTENLQKDALRDTVAGGGWALNYARVPTTEWDDSIMLLETFTAYAARLGVTVRVNVNPAGAATEVVEKQDPQRRLDALRALGGAVKWRAGKWEITGIAKLVVQEETGGRSRRTEKTVRIDLKEAAETERREGKKNETLPKWHP